MTRAARVRRLLLLLAGAALVAVTGLYFLISSPDFLRNVLLPRLSQTLKLEITVGDASVRPFSEVVLRQVKVQAPNQPPLLEAQELRVRYRLFPLLSGRVRIDELALVSPVLQVIEGPDGHDNLGILGRSRRPVGEREPAESVEPPALDISGVAVNRGTVRCIEVATDGSRAVTELANLNFALDQLKNGQPGKVALTADIATARAAPAPAATADTLKAKLNANVRFELSEALRPTTLAGQARLEVAEATGTYRDLGAMAVTLDCALTPVELTRLVLGFDQSGARIGQIQLSGPLNLEKSEGLLTLDVPAIDRRALSFLGAGRGWDFDRSVVSANCILQLSKGGAALSSHGRISGRNLVVRQRGRGNPPVDVDCLYEFGANFADRTLALQTFKLQAEQNGAEILRGTLDFPISFSWEKGVSSFTRSTLSLAVNQLDLAHWQALMGDPYLAGRVDAKLSLAASPSERQFQVNFDSRVRRLAASVGGKQVHQGDLQLKADGAYSRRESGQSLTGNLSLINPSGLAGDWMPPRYDALLAFDWEAKGDQCLVRSSRLTLRQANQPAGVVELNGRYRRGALEGELSYKVSGLNQRALDPLLGPAFAPTKLDSMNLDGAGSVRFAPGRGFDLKTDVAVADLRLSSPRQSLPAAPMALDLKLDAGASGQVMELRECVLSLPSTPRAKNQLSLQGRVNFDPTSHAPGQLRLHSEALDLAPLFDLTSTPAAREQPPSPPPQVSTAPAEPAPVKLPVNQLAFDLNIGRLYWRSLAVSNWITQCNVRQGHVILKPLSLAINGGAINSALTLDLTVPGHSYDLSLACDRLPMGPVLDSIAPANRGQFDGELAFNARIKGAGLSGTSLQRSLAGRVTAVLTNGNVLLGSPRTQSLLKPIAALLRVPELTRTHLVGLDGALNLGDGRIAIERLGLRSEAFQADVQGAVPIAPVLTDSPLDLPVVFWLRRSLAEKANFVPANTPAEAEYIRLPNFLKLVGTIGTPAVDQNQLALTGLVLKSVSGIPGVGEKAGAILQGLGGLLIGLPPAGAQTNTAPTNAPAPSPPAQPKPPRQP